MDRDPYVKRQRRASWHSEPVHPHEIFARGPQAVHERAAAALGPALTHPHAPLAPHAARARGRIRRRAHVESLCGRQRLVARVQAGVHVDPLRRPSRRVLVGHRQCTYAPRAINGEALVPGKVSLDPESEHWADMRHAHIDVHAIVRPCRHAAFLGSACDRIACSVAFALRGAAAHAIDAEIAMPRLPPRLCAVHQEASRMPVPQVNLDKLELHTHLGVDAGDGKVALKRRGVCQEPRPA